MAIISKETWDKFTQEEKDTIKCIFKKLDKDTSVNASMEYIHLFGKDNLRPQPLTYEDVARELDTCDFKEFNLKLEAIGKLLVVAKFLNKDWKPDFSDLESEKWSFGIDRGNNLRIEYSTTTNGRIVYFPTKELAEQALQILGEDMVRLALTTEY